MWLADNYVATPRKYIPNLATSQAVSPSLINFPSRLFNNASFWTKNTTTVTDANATDRNGVANKASTIVGTGNWGLSQPSGIQPTYTAGDYTIAFDYKRSGGSDQQFKCRWDSSGGTTFTATSSWQRGTHTGTLTAATHLVFFLSFDGATGASIQLCNVHVFAGTSDLLPNGETLGGHLYLGKHFSDTKPTYSGGLVDYDFGASNTGWGSIQFDAAQSFTNFTVIQLVSKTGAGTNFHALLSNAQDFNQFTPYLDTAGRPLITYAGSARGTKGSGLWSRIGMGHHAFIHTYDGTTLKIYKDNIPAVAPLALSAGPISLSDIWSGVVGATSNYGGYKWSAMAIWPRALSDAERLSAYQVLSTRAALTGNTITTPPTRWYVGEGDSISGYNSTVGANTYTYLYGASAATTTEGTVFAENNAKLGSNAGNSLNERATVLDTFLVPGANNILSVLIGANDLYNYSGGGAQYATDVATYCDARRTAGWKVAIGTVLPRSDTGITAPQIAVHNTQRAIFNTAVRTWVGVHANVVMDFAADATMGPDAASDSTTYYFDKLHPKQAGQDILAGIAKTALDSL